MADSFFALTRDDQREVLEQARAKIGRPAHLLEKDVWVVWTLGALFDSPLAADLTFKGGTSLSKAYGVIDRFSEDIDLTCDIRKLAADLTGGEESIPVSRSQASKWSKAVRDRLPDWIARTVRPVLEAALAHDKLNAKLEIAGEAKEQLLLSYPPINIGSGYVQPVINLEFGGRATGEPNGVMRVVCDMDGHVEGVTFPVARPVVMSVGRTFWEKATAAHVYCGQGRIRGERYARHWHDLAAIARSEHFDAIMTDHAVAQAVADHKTYFFSEKDLAGEVIDYSAAVNGQLKIVPEGDARVALSDDYAKMVADDVMVGDALPSDDLMKACAAIATRANVATPEG
jgi:hypothetical protein